ncbi:hypothetical protein S7711_02167 [Stachybotrys chartarum IBT 7711]|uniref:Alpha/beta hydrolase fold-3 domain-containing protein n=1 Tax=Stachybotrys chartarum (strain CBS 109288 / IBT 7711) TaxID=1280523 RepID=A0A084ARN3_STACB|nr:hypothetical protein S7711_02167 [Stachybotrys chartarum IBT 7711]
MEFTGRFPYSPGIKEKVVTIESRDGAELALGRFAMEETIDSVRPLRAIVYIHNGGLVFGKVTTTVWLSWSLLIQRTAELNVDAA